MQTSGNRQLIKTNIVIFRKGRVVSSKEHWYYKGVSINVVNQYTYLGVKLQHTMNLKTTVSDLSLRAKRALIQIISVSFQLGSVTPNIFFKLFDFSSSTNLTIWG